MSPLVTGTCPETRVDARPGPDPVYTVSPTHTLRIECQWALRESDHNSDKCYTYYITPQEKLRGRAALRIRAAQFSLPCCGRGDEADPATMKLFLIRLLPAKVIQNKRIKGKIMPSTQV